MQNGKMEQSQQNYYLLRKKNMKHIFLLLFCISMLAGCSQRHEALADGHMLNDGKPPKNPVSINTLFPAELKNVGKVEPSKKNDWYLYDDFLYGSYYHDNHRHYHDRRYYPDRRVLTPWGFY